MLKSILEDAKKLIQVSSISTQGNEEISNVIASMMQDRGIKTQVQQVTHSMEDVSKRQFNVIGIVGDPLVDRKTRKGLLLCAHLDTVSPGLPEAWTESGGKYNVPTVKEGKIFGLGSADAKLDFLCKLKAAEKFREKKLKQPIYLVGTCGEEVGMLGTKYLIKSLALNPQYVLVGEPTQLKLVTGHKSVSLHHVSIGFHQLERDAKGFSRRIDLTSYGKSAHGAFPSQGQNAVGQLIEFLHRATENGFDLQFTSFDGGDACNKVPDIAKSQFFLTAVQFEEFKRFFRESVKLSGKDRAYRVELGGLGDVGVKFLPKEVFRCMTDVISFFHTLSEELKTKEDARYIPPQSTVNLGLVKQRSTSIELSFDLRLLPEISVAEINQRISDGLKKISGSYPTLNVVEQVDKPVPAFQASSEEWIKVCLEAMKAANISPVTTVQSPSTEAAFFEFDKYPALVFGAGVNEGNAASANEHNLLEQMEKAIAFYERVIEKTCL